jgi:hypothetical protein
VYITKTWATRIINTVFFKHQYITNPTVSPESHVVAAAQQLATALKGNILAGNETAEALKKVNKLFTKIAAAKTRQQKPRNNATESEQHPQHERQHTFQGWKHQFQGWPQAQRKIVV